MTCDSVKNKTTVPLFIMVTDLAKLCLYLCLEILFRLGKKLCQEVKITFASGVMHRRRVLM